MKKILFFTLIILFFFILPKNIFAKTVTNRDDGTFLLDGQPYFPLGFWPQGLVYNVPLSDWQDLKNSGFNFTNDALNRSIFTDFNNKLKTAGINLVFIAYSGKEDIPATTKAEEIVNFVKNEPNLLGYYGNDEPSGPASPYTISFYQALYAKDPAHFLWTNYFLVNCKPLGDDPDYDICKIASDYNKNNRMWVSGADVYTETWPNVGYSARQFNQYIKNTLGTQTFFQSLSPSRNISNIMMISGYHQLWGIPLSYSARLNGTIDAIINGANGIMFYTDNADYLFDNHYIPGEPSTGSWTTDANWTKYKNSSTYNEIKKISTLLKNAYPGLIGTKNTSIASNLPLLAKNGIDSKLYLFLANENMTNSVQANLQGLPANLNFTEIIENKEYSSNQLASFTLPANSVRIYIQKSDLSCPEIMCAGVYSGCLDDQECATCCPAGDLDFDKKVNILDLRQFLKYFLDRFPLFDYNRLVENFGK